MRRSWQENRYSRGRAGEQSGLTGLIIMIDDRAAAGWHSQEPEPPAMKWPGRMLSRPSSPSGLFLYSVRHFGS